MSDQSTPVSPLTPAEAFDQGWHAAVLWLRYHADFHAGRWSGMEPREALKAAAQAMETANAR